MKEQITDTERMRLEELFLLGAKHVSEEDEYWIHGYDEGESYCLECAHKKVEELRQSDPDGEYCVDGGWGTDGDSTAFCKMCGQRLWNTLTEYGCEAEVDHFLSLEDYSMSFNPMNSHECLDMHRVISSGGWEPWGETNRKERGQYFKGLYKLCRIILDNHFWIMPNNDYRHMWD